MFRHTMLFLGYELGNVRPQPGMAAVRPHAAHPLPPAVRSLLTGLPIGGKPTPDAGQRATIFTPGMMMIIALFGSLFAGFA